MKKRNMKDNKLLILSISAFLISAAYALVSPLKVSVLSSIGNAKQLPLAELLSLVTLFIIIPLYSKFSLKFKNIKAPIITIGAFALLQILMAIITNIYLLNPVKITTVHKILSIIFYNFIDLHVILSIGSLWSIASSTISSEEANKKYYFITGVALTGGLLTNYLGMYTQSITSLLFISSALLIVSCIILKNLEYSHTNNTTQHLSKIQEKKSLQKTLFHPYFIGIFIMFFAYEFVIKIYNYRLYNFVSMEFGNSISQATNFIFRYKFIQTLISSIGLIFSYSILNKVSQNLRLSLLPSIMAILTIGILINPSLYLAASMTTISKGLYSGIYYPTREMLYAPDMVKSKFQIRTIIESFGKAAAIVLAAICNLIFFNVGAYNHMFLSTMIIVPVLILWITATFRTNEKLFYKKRTNPIGEQGV